MFRTFVISITLFRRHLKEAVFLRVFVSWFLSETLDHVVTVHKTFLIEKDAKAGEIFQDLVRTEKIVSILLIFADGFLHFRYTK